MCLATCDSVIEKEKKKVIAKNEKLIKEYYALPSYRRWFIHPVKIADKIIANWEKFETWMNERMKKMCEL